jgi:hypothetical protein
VAGRAIFRETALEAYRRRTGRDVVPRLTYWPIIVCMWVLLAVLLGTLAGAWAVRVPTYVSAPGVILGSGDVSRTSGDVTAALFVPPDQSDRLRVGQPVHGQTGSSGEHAAGKVVAIESSVISPDAARDRYRIDGAADVITQPSRVVTLRLHEAPRSTASSGSRLDAQIRVGTQPLLALFPVLGKLFGRD